MKISERGHHKIKYRKEETMKVNQADLYKFKNSKHRRSFAQIG
jgi:hypothetical protein